MTKEIDKLLSKHKQLIHSENQKVLSHVQRETSEWVHNTVMVQGCDVPFKYNRKQKYKSLKGAVVNITYYPATEVIAGFEMEIMKTTRIKIS
jgi:hypothetical protein